MAPDGGRSLLFYEEREDAVVEVGGSGGAPGVWSSRHTGLAVRGQTDLALFRGDPDPADVARLLRGAGVGGREAAGSGPDRDPPAPWPPVLPIPGAQELVRRLAETTERLSPGATIGVRWVAFRQVVTVARPGLPLAGDVRQGARVRVAAGRRGDEAVAEAPVSTVEPALTGDCARLPEEVARRLDERRRLTTLPCGEHEVVFGPAVGGVLVHEIVGHALEADAALDGRSWLAEAGGAEVATPELTVVDDPRRGRAPWKTDDEGEPARPIALVREGRVTGYLHDLRTSRECGQLPTGHGRRASYRDPVRPRMGCTFVAAGRRHPDEVIEGIESGIYVRRMEAARTDPRTGRAVFRVTDADRIHRGRLDGALAAHLLIVEGRAALRSIGRVAADLAFDRCPGSCLREGQALAVGVGAPTFRLGSALAVFGP